MWHGTCKMFLLGLLMFSGDEKNKAGSQGMGRSPYATRLGFHRTWCLPHQTIQTVHRVATGVGQTCKHFTL